MLQRTCALGGIAFFFAMMFGGGGAAMGCGLFFGLHKSPPLPEDTPIEERRADVETQATRSAHQIRKFYQSHGHAPTTFDEAGLAELKYSEFSTLDTLITDNQRFDAATGQTRPTPVLTLAPGWGGDARGRYELSFDWQTNETVGVWYSGSPIGYEQIDRVRSEGIKILTTLHQHLIDDYAERGVERRTLDHCPTIRHSMKYGRYYTAFFGIRRSKTDEGRYTLRLRIKRQFQDYGDVHLTFDWDGTYTRLDWDNPEEFIRSSKDEQRNEAVMLLIPLMNEIRRHYGRKWVKAKSMKQLDGLTADTESEHFSVQNELGGSSTAPTIILRAKNQKNAEVSGAILTFDWRYPEYQIEWDTDE